MSMLFDTVYRSECTSTHHKLAMDALRHLRGKQADGWTRVFVRYYEDYLDGAKAPDKKFRDFRNHVLHVADNYWGGAVKAAETWYDRAVECLVKQDWTEAIYCAGVVSHYYTDVLMPLHTGQTEEEGAVHRALEWSVCKSYNEIARSIAEYPELETPAGDNWLEQMIHKAAITAHEHYQCFVDNYDLEAGRRRPQAGLNDELRERIGQLFAHATVGTSRILERMIQDAQAKPPQVRIGLLGLLTRLTSPFGRLNQWRCSRADKKAVAKIYREWKRTGCVIDSLPPDEREVRKSHAEEVLGVSLEDLNQLTREAAAAAARALELAKEQDAREPDERADERADDEGASREAEDDGPAIVRITAESTSDVSHQPTYHLHRQSPVVDAPSIGSKTARRLHKIGVHTVDDLLSMEPDEAADQLNSSYMTPQTLRNWQRQASLVCRIPNLRGHDAQMLVGCKMADPQLIANMAPGELLDRVEEFLLSEEGERLLGRNKEPDREEVTKWIRWAQQARKLTAA